MAKGLGQVVGHVSKRRVLQDRDRQLLAGIGMARVISLDTLHKVYFPGRDWTTFANRMAELARDVHPVGPCIVIDSRTLGDGSLERYARLTDLGYAQAQLVMPKPAFYRTPTAPLRASHVEHDLDLANFMASLLPTTKAQYAPTRQGKPVGTPLEVAEPRLWAKARWYHHSIFMPLSVFEVERDVFGRAVSKAKHVTSYEPDAILETDTYNETRYLIELDRGTEPIASLRERSSIEGKLHRIFDLIWAPWQKDPRLADWHQRDSHYCRLLPGAKLRRPKVVFVTTSQVRATHIYECIRNVFGALKPTFDIDDAFEVMTRDVALAKFKKVLGWVEAAEPNRERPWEIRAKKRIVLIEKELAAREAKRAEEEAALVAKVAAERAARQKVIADTATAKSPRHEYLCLDSAERAKLPQPLRSQVEVILEAIYQERRTVKSEAENRKILDDIYHRNQPPPPPTGMAAMVEKAKSLLGA